MMNSFDEFIAYTINNHEAEKWRPHVIVVADTMYVCKKWFEGHDVKFTAADLLTMAKLVLDRENVDEEA